MKIFEKIIEAIDIKLSRAYMLEAVHPFIFDGAINERNVLVRLNNGEMSDAKNVKVKPDNYYFIPQSQYFQLHVGKSSKAVNTKDRILTDEVTRDQYIKPISSIKYNVTKKEILTIISFEATLYGAFPFFSLLEMPPFHLPADEEIACLTKTICYEVEDNRLGKEMVIKNYLKVLVVNLFRYIESHPDLNRYIEKLNYLTDKRLLDIVNYVQENLSKDLSNKSIANVAFVSEDYVGQFFKTLTNRNLQDYIEDQRLAKALQMLKSNPESVQEISHRVGFKDPAYFSRRFKMKFGINANAVKQGKVQVV